MGECESPQKSKVSFYCCEMKATHLMVAILVGEIGLSVLAALASYEIVGGFQMSHYLSLGGCATVLIGIDIALLLRNLCYSCSPQVQNEREYIDNIINSERLLWESKPDRPGQRMGTDDKLISSVPESIKNPAEL
jgi:hypothetical protein